MTSCRVDPAETAAKDSESSWRFPCVTAQSPSHDVLPALTACRLCHCTRVHYLKVKRRFANGDASVFRCPSAPTTAEFAETVASRNTPGQREIWNRLGIPLLTLEGRLVGQVRLARFGQPMTDDDTDCVDRRADNGSSDRQLDVVSLPWRIVRKRGRDVCSKGSNHSPSNVCRKRLASSAQACWIYPWKVVAPEAELGHSHERGQKHPDTKEPYIGACQEEKHDRKDEQGRNSARIAAGASG